MNPRLLYSFHRRTRRYNYNSVLQDYLRYRDDLEFGAKDPFQSFIHRIHSHSNDCDDDDNIVAAGDKSSGEYMDNFTKWNRTRLGLPMPKEWENSLDKH